MTTQLDQAATQAPTFKVAGHFADPYAQMLAIKAETHKEQGITMEHTPKTRKQELEEFNQRGREACFKRDETGKIQKIGTLDGANSYELQAMMKAVKEDVYKELGIQVDDVVAKDIVSNEPASEDA